MNDIERMHLEYDELSGQSIIVDSNNGEFVYYNDYLIETERLKDKHHQALELLKIFVGDESMNPELIKGHIEKAKILINGKERN